MIDRKKIIDIALVRARNNDLWMELLQIALESDFDAAKAVLEQINKNDKEISDRLSELVK